MNTKRGSVTAAGSATRKSAMLRLPATTPTAAKSGFPRSVPAKICIPKFRRKAKASQDRTSKGVSRSAGPSALMSATTRMAKKSATAPSSVARTVWPGSGKSFPRTAKPSPTDIAITSARRRAAWITSAKLPSAGTSQSTGMIVSGNSKVPVSKSRIAGAGS